MSFPYKRVVMVSAARLGDTLFLTPAIRVLKSYRQDVEIDVICPSELSASVLAYNPNINQLYVTPAKRKIEEKIGYYDIGIKIHDNDMARKYFNWLKVDVINRLPIDQNKHTAQQALDLIESLLGCNISDGDRGYDLYPQSHHSSRAKDLLLSQGASLTKDILIGCHLGCHGLAKRGAKFWKSLEHKKVWSLEKFIKLEAEARRLDPRIRFVLTGSKGERALARVFRRKSKHVIDLLGKTSVLELTALMDYLKLYITSDTGPLHVACATNVNLIALFISPYLTRTAPYPHKPHQTIICRPTMAEIEVEDVLRNLKRFLSC
jgi:ADP-heptose:LPS heptosyltransferase